MCLVSVEFADTILVEIPFSLTFICLENDSPVFQHALWKKEIISSKGESRYKQWWVVISNKLQ